MGDWVQGEFQVVEQVVGEDYICLLGLGVNEIILIGGDVFYFLVQDDLEVEVVQKCFVVLLLSLEVQVLFNFVKGLLLVCGDVNFEVVNDCMCKGFEIFVLGNVLFDGI